jgi:hypothetical protein
MSVEDELKRVGETYRPRPAWQQRVLREVERPQRQSSVALVVVPSLAALVLAGALGFFLYVSHHNQVVAEDRARAQQTALQHANEELEGKLEQIQAQQQAINTEKDQLIAQLQAAKTKEDTDRINAQIFDNQRRAMAAQEQIRQMQQQIKMSTTRHPACPPNDPLCGM